VADLFRKNDGKQEEEWLRGLAHLRLEEPAKAIEYLERAEVFAWKWPGLALAYHRAGRSDAARSALERALTEADREMRAAITADPVSSHSSGTSGCTIGSSFGSRTWRFKENPLLDSPYERLHRGRCYSHSTTAGSRDEFAAAVELRPNDADIWLTRSHIYAKLGRKDRMTADLLRASSSRATTPKRGSKTGPDARPCPGRRLGEAASACCVRPARRASGPFRSTFGVVALELLGTQQIGGHSILATEFCINVAAQ